MKRTIASLALLRMNWDKYKKDYIEVFIPFIVTLISKKKYQIINENVIRQDFKEEYGLSIPYYPMITILRRTKKRGYIDRKDGIGENYKPVKDLVEADEFSENAAVLERKYNKVLNKFVDFCKMIDVIINLEDADRILIAFLRDYDLDIIFANYDVQSLLPDVSNTDKEKYLIGKYIQVANVNEPEVFGFLVDISFGHIIANAILYDINLEKFQGKISANCYLDTGILFDLLGLNYESRQTASKELLQSLIGNRSSIYVFRHTYDELLGIINGCIEWVENKLYDPYKASRALLFFKDQEFTASEVESFILNIEKQLDDLHIKIIDAPDPNDQLLQRFQIDEKELQEFIVNTYKQKNPFFDETDKDFTLYQDVKSISTVCKLRRGYKPLKISDAKHIFITSNATLAFASRQFECMDAEINDEGLGRTYFFIPTTMTDVFIGTLLWGQSPAKIISINQKKLISNCYAAMQPTKQLMKKYTQIAEREYKKGVVTEDEYTILKVSRMARNILVEETMNDPDLFTEKNITDILSEIRDSIRSEETARFDIDREEYEIQHRQSQEAMKKINRELETTKTDKDRIVTNIENIAEKVSNIIARIMFLILAILAIITLLFQITPTSFRYPILRIGLGILTFLFAGASIFTGFNIVGAREMIKIKTKELIILIFMK